MASFDDRLDDAINRMMAGQPLPEQADLRSLLRPAQALMEAPVPAPAQRTARVRMNAALDAQRGRKRMFGLGWLPGLTWLRPQQWIPAMVVAAVVILFLLSTFAMPGQPLYPLKQSTEAFGLLLARNPQAQAQYYVDLADRRLSEMERLVAKGRPVPAVTLAQFQRAWEEALAIPNVDRDALRPQAEDQARRLNQLIPNLPPDLRDDAQNILDFLILQFHLDEFPAPTPLPPTPSFTPSPTPTPTPPVNTPTAPQGGIPPEKETATPTPDSGGTLIPPAPTETPKVSPAPTEEATPTATTGPHPPTATSTETPNPNWTATPSPTVTPTVEPAISPTLEPTDPPTVTVGPPSPTSTPTSTPARTPTRTHTPGPKPSLTPTRTPPPQITATPTQTPTLIPTITPRPTDTPTHTPQPTHTPRPTNTPQPTHTPSPTVTRTHTPEATKTPHKTETPESTETPEPPKTPHVSVVSYQHFARSVVSLSLTKFS